MRMLWASVGTLLLLAAGAVSRTPAAVRGPDVAAALAPSAVSGSRPGTALTATRDDDPDAGIDLLGRPAPAWSFDRWVRGPATTLAGLRGKVVLVRWWTEDCHFCAHTLPVLETLRKREAGRDLVVIGVFHPKPPREVSDRHILRVASQLGFQGPIAFDRDWKTLGRYWLDGRPDRSWTSVSFLIDRQGLIRWVHGGGEYHPSNDPRHQRCDLQYRELESVLSVVLAERAEPTSSR